jgi:hypothetical protein
VVTYLPAFLRALPLLLDQVIEGEGLPPHVALLAGLISDLVRAPYSITQH